jgi:hypothetical protein
MGYYTTFKLSYTVDSNLVSITQSEIQSLEEAYKACDANPLSDGSSTLVKDLILEKVASLKELLSREEDMKKAVCDFVGYEVFGSSCKWYSFDNDMVAFSALHPNYLFELEGWGEEDGDIWRAYFQNGKYYKVDAEVIFPPYDESKMT